MKNAGSSSGVAGIWAALGESHRRQLIELLSSAPRSTGELVSALPELSRTMVMKHLDVLESARLITVQRIGRTRMNQLNIKPLEDVCETWLQERASSWKRSLQNIKELAVERHAKTN